MFLRVSTSHYGTSTTSTTVVVVESAKLLQEDKREDRVRAQASVVRREPFPETEEPFSPNQLAQYVLTREGGREGGGDKSVTITL